VYLYSAAQGPNKDNWEIVQKPDKNDNEAVPRHALAVGRPNGVRDLRPAGRRGKPPGTNASPRHRLARQAGTARHYAIAMRCQMYPYLPDPTPSDVLTPGTLSKKQMAERDAHTLTHDMYASGEHAGLYSYYADDHWAPAEELVRHECQPDQRAWASGRASSGGGRAGDYWAGGLTRPGESSSIPTGAGLIRPGKPEPWQQTAPVVATLHITQEYEMMNRGVHICAGGSRNDNIDRGLDRIDKKHQRLAQSAGEYGCTRCTASSASRGQREEIFRRGGRGARRADYLGAPPETPTASFGKRRSVPRPLKVPGHGVRHPVPRSEAGAGHR